MSVGRYKLWPISILLVGVSTQDRFVMRVQAVRKSVEGQRGPVEPWISVPFHMSPTFGAMANCSQKTQHRPPEADCTQLISKPYHTS